MALVEKLAQDERLRVKRERETNAVHVSIVFTQGLNLLQHQNPGILLTKHYASYVPCYNRLKCSQAASTRQVRSTRLFSGPRNASKFPL